jgi:hypothetical protein
LSNYGSLNSKGKLPNRNSSYLWPFRIFNEKSFVNTVHAFKVEGIAGGTIDFAAFAGKKILIVNVASECGLTPHPDSYREAITGIVRGI